MSWQLGLSRFIHGWQAHLTAAPSHFSGTHPLPPPMHARLKPRGTFTAKREADLLPALVCAIFDSEGRFGAWPPTRVTELLDLAGLDRAQGNQHHLGPNFPGRFYRGALPRGCRQTLLIEGMSALDEGLLLETGARFEALSPTLRGYVLNAFERGALGYERAEAERFIDCMVETVTFAFLNFELDLSPLPASLERRSA